MPRPRTIGLFAGPLLAALMLASPPPAGLSPTGWHIAAVAALMAVWWMTEALPLAATALVPLVLFPLLGVQPIADTAPAYANPLIFLFLGGFLLARAMQVWHLDRRLALAVLRLVGTSPAIIVAGIMGVTAFLSMWISNTATAMVMLPIGTSIVAVAHAGGAGGRDGFATALMLGIAYAATIGGMGSIIGTPPNALFVAYMAETHGIEIGFAQWLAVGVPLVLVLLPIAWLVLTRIAFRVGRAETGAVAASVAAQIDELGPLPRGGKLAALAMGLAAAGWLTRPLVEGLFPGLHLSDAGIAVACALLLFILPVDLAKGRFVLSWQEAAAIRWDVLILFGGGLALAGAIAGSDLATWIGAKTVDLGALPVIVVLLIVGTVIVLASELASNTATAAVFLPIAGAAALAMGEPAIVLALPVALFATLGFMLPVATPPNAIVFGSGAVEMRHMLRAGAFVNVAGILVVAGVVLTLGRWVLGAG